MLLTNKTEKHLITNTDRLADELRRIRRERKISQQEIAARADIARRTVINAEGGENVGLKEISKIANALGYELVLRPKNAVVFEELSDVFKDE